MELGKRKTVTALRGSAEKQFEALIRLVLNVQELDFDSNILCSWTLSGRQPIGREPQSVCVFVCVCARAFA